MDVGDDYTGEGTPLTDTQRNIIIVLHYLTFVAVTFALYAYYKTYAIFLNRIWSPFILLIALTWLEIGPAFEIGNHFYVNNWQLFDSQADLINASFSFFNFGSQNLLALSLRKKGLPLLRKGESLLEWVVILFDGLFVLLTVAQPFVYVYLGRDTSVTFLSPIGALAGICTLFRVWFNLGPNNYTKWGGILFFTLAICGVIALQVYRTTQLEWVHAFIGGSFVSSVIPLSIGFLNAEMLPDGAGGGFASESTPLNV